MNISKQDLLLAGFLFLLGGSGLGLAWHAFLWKSWHFMCQQGIVGLIAIAGAILILWVNTEVRKNESSNRNT